MAPPPWLQNMPELELGNELALMAFYELCGDRQSGFGAGPIPWTAVDAWCRAHEIRGFQRESLHFLIKNLDLAYLQWSKENAPKPPPKPET